MKIWKVFVALFKELVLWVWQDSILLIVQNFYHISKVKTWVERHPSQIFVLYQPATFKAFGEFILINPIVAVPLKIKTCTLEHVYGIRVVHLRTLIKPHIKLPSRPWLWGSSLLIGQCYPNLNQIQIIHVASDPLVMGLKLQIAIDPPLSLFNDARKLCILVDKNVRIKIEEKAKILTNEMILNSLVSTNEAIVAKTDLKLWCQTSYISDFSPFCFLSAFNGDSFLSWIWT